MNVSFEIIPPDFLSAFRMDQREGLVVFEINGTLLKYSRSPVPRYLGDLSPLCVKVLQRLRKRNIRFGFISHQEGMEPKQGRIEAATLIQLLDELLGVNGVRPDFWIACPNFEAGLANHAEAMVAQAIIKYGVKVRDSVFVTATGETGLSSIPSVAWEKISQTKQPESKPDGADSNHITALIRAITKSMHIRSLSAKFRPGIGQFD